MRTNDGVGGSIVGVGSRTRGGPTLIGDETISGLLEISVIEVDAGAFRSGFGARSGNGLQNLSLPNGSSSGVNRGTTDLQVVTIGEDPGEGGCSFVYLMRMSCQRSNNGSGTWSFQLTACRKAISFVLISHTVRPEILLQARAE